MQTQFRNAAGIVAACAFVAFGFTSSVSAVTPPAQKSGARLYSDNCAFCHGTFGQGGIVGKSVVGSRECVIREAIDHFIPGMAYLSFLSPAEVQAIAEHLNSGTVSDQQRYDVSCGGCHGPDGRKPNRVGEDVQGESFSEILDAIHEEDPMRYLKCLPASDIQQIANFL